MAAKYNALYCDIVQYRCLSHIVLQMSITPNVFVSRGFFIINLLS